MSDCETKICPSGDHATLLTASVWPSRVCKSAPLCPSHSRTVCTEEALARVEIGSLLAAVSVTGAGQVHVMFRAKLLHPKFAPGPESLEVGLYGEAEIPWTQLAFPSGEFTLRKYFEDRTAGREDHHFVELSRRLKS